MTKEERREYNKAYRAANAGKAKEYRAANAGKAKEYKKNYYAANAEKLKECQKNYRVANAEKAKEYQKNYRVANAEKAKEYQKNYRVANAEKAKECRKSWIAANPELYYTITTKHRALKLNRLHPDHDVEIERSLYILAKNLEAIFNEPFDIDHILPYECGGVHHHLNLQVIPARINRSKQNNLDYECNWPGYKTWKDLPDYLLIYKK